MTAIVTLMLSDAERDHFTEHARRAGKTLDAWLLSVARQHAGRPKRTDEERFKSLEELEAFFPRMRKTAGPGAGTGLGRTPEEHQRITPPRIA